MQTISNRTITTSVLAVVLVIAGFLTGSAYEINVGKNAAEGGRRVTTHNGFYNNQQLQDTKQPGILRMISNGETCSPTHPIATYTDWSGYIRASVISTTDLASEDIHFLEGAEHYIANVSTDLAEVSSALNLIRTELFNDDCATYKMDAIRVGTQAVTMDGYQGRAFLVTRGTQAVTYDTAIYVLMQKNDSLLLLSRSMVDVGDVVRHQADLTCSAAFLTDAAGKEKCEIESRNAQLTSAFYDENLNSRAIGLFSLFQPILN